jgi:hypothetical protein
MIAAIEEQRLDYVTLSSTTAFELQLASYHVRSYIMQLSYDALKLCFALQAAQ